MALIGMALITFAGEQTLELSERGHAAQLAQAKLAEVIAGIQPLSSQGDAAIEDEADWMWSLTAEQDAVPGLWHVEIKVHRERRAGGTYEARLHQKVLDPSIRGSTLDAAAAAAAAAAANASSSSTTTNSQPTTPQSTTNNNSNTAAPPATSTAKPAATGGAMPAPAAAPPAAAPAPAAPAPSPMRSPAPAPTAAPNTGARGKS